MFELSRSARIALFAALLAFGGVVISHAHAAPAAATRDESTEDFKSVQAVCSRCHGVALFMSKPRPWNRWNEVFMRMTAHGASPTEEQADHIVRYFLANLTLVNVNSAPADELSLALGVSEEVAGKIVARRDRRKFHDLADLRSIAGVDTAILEQRKSRIQF